MLIILLGIWIIYIFYKNQRLQDMQEEIWLLGERLDYHMDDHDRERYTKILERRVKLLEEEINKMRY